MSFKTQANTLCPVSVLLLAFAQTRVYIGLLPKGHGYLPTSIFSYY